MKRIILLLLAVLLLISGCGNKYAPVSFDYRSDKWEFGAETGKLYSGNGEVSVSLSEDSLTAKGAEFMIRNTGSTAYKAKDNSQLHVLIDGTWYVMRSLVGKDVPASLSEDSLVGENFGVSPASRNYVECDWSKSHGALPPGTYRYCKPLTPADKSSKAADIYLLCEFTITEEIVRAK